MAGGATTSPQTPRSGYSACVYMHTCPYLCKCVCMYVCTMHTSTYVHTPAAAEDSAAQCRAVPCKVKISANVCVCVHGSMSRTHATSMSSLPSLVSDIFRLPRPLRAASGPPLSSDASTQARHQCTTPVTRHSSTRSLPPSHHHNRTPPVSNMSLVSGPGRAATTAMPDNTLLFVDKHVRYIQSLDTVRASCFCLAAQAPGPQIPR